MVTKREADVLQFINDYIEDFHYAPAIRDISDGLYLNSHYSVQRHIIRLVDKGYLNSGCVARSLYITAKGKEYLENIHK